MANDNVLEIRIGYPKTEANPRAIPLPTQRKFHNSKAKYRLLAGGFGSGKSTSLAIEVLKEVFSYPQNYGVLGRKDLGELKSTTLKELFDICPPKLIIDHNKQEKTIKFINGSVIYYMNLDASREAVEKIKSLNLGFVAIDQLEEIAEDIFFAFQGRLRRLVASRNFFATCNPAGHDWVWRTFKINDMLHHGQSVMYKDGQYNPDYALFEATTLENIYLPEDYVKQLLGYPKQWVDRFVYCSWEDFEGMVYNEFNERVNVIDYYEPREGETHIHAMDYGYRNPTCILFASTDYDGVTTVYDEIYERERLIPDIASMYKSNVYSKKATRIADPSIHKTERDGKNVFQEFNENGVWWDRADNNVLQGISRVNQLFSVGKLRITKNCVNLLTEIGDYKWKAIKPAQERNNFEEPVKKDDHAMDALRYLVNYLSIPQIKNTPLAPARRGMAGSLPRPSTRF